MAVGGLFGPCRPAPAVSSALRHAGSPHWPCRQPCPARQCKTPHHTIRQPGRSVKSCSQLSFILHSQKCAGGFSGGFGGVKAMTPRYGQLDLPPALSRCLCSSVMGIDPLLTPHCGLMGVRQLCSGIVRHAMFLTLYCGLVGVHHCCCCRRQQSCGYA